MTLIRPVQHVTEIRPTVVRPAITVDTAVVHVDVVAPVTEVNPACSCSSCAGSSAGGDLTLSYDVDGRLVEVVDEIQGTITLTYDVDDRLVGVASVDSTTTLEYDADDRLVAVLVS